MSLLKHQAGKYDDVDIHYTPLREFHLDILKKPQMRMPRTEEDQAIQWINANYPQIQIKYSRMTPVEIVKALQDGRVSFPRAPAPKQETKINPVDYWLALRKQLDSGKKLSVKEAMNLWKFELSQASSCVKKQLIQELEEDSKLRETMKL